MQRPVLTAHLRLREEFGSLRGITEPTVRALLLGILRRMRERGAIWSEVNERFLKRGASLWWLNRQLPLQEFGRRSARPFFPADGVSGDGLESLVGGGQRRSWYRVWTEKMLARPPLALTMADAPGVLLEGVAALEDAGLVRPVPVGPSNARAHAWALVPERFSVTPRVAVLRGGSVRPLVAPADETDLWLGLPCLDLTSTDAYDRFETPEPTWFGRLYQRSGVRRAVRCRRCCLG